MTINIISAHPYDKSLNNALMEAFIDGCRIAEHKVQIFDLYKMNFNPCKSKEETYNNQYGADVIKIQNDLLKGDALVFFYPVWWSTMPAILKGFIDRVFTDGFAFRRGKLGIKGNLPFIKAAIINSQGAPKIYDIIAGDPGIKLMKRILKMCGIKKVKTIKLTSTMNCKPERIRLFIEKVRLLAKSF